MRCAHVWRKGVGLGRRNPARELYARIRHDARFKRAGLPPKLTEILVREDDAQLEFACLREEVVDRIVGEVEEFLTGSRSEAEIDRVLATVMFTDIVESTKRAAELGDRQWRALLERHDETVRQQLARFRGQEVKNLGDGFLATFDGPARAVRCASAIADAVQPLGIAVRSGLHTGEIELKPDDIGGIAAHIAARVADIAEASETVVSSTVRDLVAGSGLRFRDRGIHALRGLPEELHLYSLLTAA